MNLEAVRALVAEDWKAYSALMGQMLESGVPLLLHLNEEVLSHAGKQMRPLLCLFSARACRPDMVTGEGSAPASTPLPENTLRYAAAAELLHNATLLHDDVADASDLRRGRPTVRSRYGADVSVLLGDYWLSQAVESITGGKDYDPAITRIFAKTLRDLSEGEIFQLEKASEGDTSIEDYLRIIYGKTASLFEASALSGACSVGAGEAQKTALKTYARCLGIAFQIRDDIFDYCPGMDTGKPSCEDILKKKITLPLLGAFENAAHKEEQALREAIVRGEEGLCARVMEYVQRYDGIAYAQERLEAYVSEALAALEVLPESPYRSAMEEMARFMAVREK